MKDTPDNWKKAQQIALTIEADLEHPDWDKLLDPTFSKYGIGNTKYKDKLVNILQLPSYVTEMTVGEMWEDYLIWKQPQLQPTTFLTTFAGTYTNVLKGLVWNNKAQKFESTGDSLWGLPLSITNGDILVDIKVCPHTKIRLCLALNEAFTRAQSLGRVRLSINPFFEFHKKIGDNTKDKYKQTVGKDGEILEWWQLQDAKEDELESDKRAFSKEERDIIVKAFYESPKENERHAAPLIEFLFLTGCRPGEAFALRWQDVMFERGYVRFSKSYNGRLKNTQQTKTGDIRLFKLYDRLTELLLKIKTDSAIGTNLVFKQRHKVPFNSDTHGNLWKGYISHGINYSGCVTRLVEQSKISTYLPPYHARHTYITLTAHANSENSSALLLLAHSSGNSVEILLKHYLGVDTSVELNNV